MASTQPLRDFLKRLLALPLLGAPQLAAPRATELDFNVFPVAGFGFHEGPEIIRRLQPGDELMLVPEPHNPHDPRAIRIEARGRHIGYVPRSENRPLGRLLEQGAELRARVVRVQPEAESWDVLRVGVGLRLT
jgi:hypothetical protein